MKKIFTLLLIVLSFTVSTDIKAQVVKGEGFIGLNLSQVDGDEAYGYKHFGFHAGLGALVPIYQKNSFNIDFSLEIAFNQKGAHQRPETTV